MLQFTYSFCMMMLHSFWQAAVILGLYICLDKFIHRNNAPLAKRNFLYIALGAQFLLSGLTFFMYYADAAGLGKIAVVTENIGLYLGSNNIRSVTPWLFSLYIFVVAFKLIKAIFHWYHFKMQYKTGLQKPSVTLKLFTQIKARQFGIKRQVTLWLSHSVKTPLTFGFFKPIILLPVALINHLTPQQAETLILHELTHIRTNDYLLNWYLIAAETIFFFNPFLINLCKKIRLERELNCDVNVMAFEYSPALYAETLLQAERMKKPVPQFQLAAVDQKKQLLKRIQFFTSKKIIDRSLRFNIVVPVLGLFLLIMLSAAIIFQSGTTAQSVHSASEMQAPPFIKYLIPDYEFGNQIIYGNSIGLPAKKTKENKRPVIENKTEKTIRPVSTSAETPNNEPVITPAELNYALPIATKENDAARQIIIKEEGSEASSIKVYNLRFQDGKWVLQPEWIMTANEINVDSLRITIDSLKVKLGQIYPSQQ